VTSWQRNVQILIAWRVIVSESISTGPGIWSLWRLQIPGQVRRFMEKRPLFVLVKWTEGFHYPELTGLAQEFDYQFHVVFKPAPHQSRGVFRPI
jgi:hypothetical protein